MTNPSINLYGVSLSGHCHRVELLLRVLGLPYAYVDAPAAMRESSEFRKLNPLGQIPVLTDGDVVISDSNAIMVYLVKRYALDSHWLPTETLAAAELQRWLSISAGEVRFGPATARMITLWNAAGDIERATGIAARLLAFMEQHLAARRYLVDGAHPTLADLACYSYVAHAPDGGIDLAPYPAVRAWLRRVEDIPDFAPMPQAAA